MPRKTIYVGLICGTVYRRILCFLILIWILVGKISLPVHCQSLFKHATGGPVYKQADIVNSTHISRKIYQHKRVTNERLKRRFSREQGANTKHYKTNGRSDRNTGVSDL